MNCVSTRSILLLSPSPSISCKIFRQCSSPFSVKRASLMEMARSILTNRAFLQTTRDEKWGNAHRKGFDGRDGGAEGRPLWRLHPEGGLEFSSERLSIQPSLHSRAWFDQMGRSPG